MKLKKLKTLQFLEYAAVVIVAAPFYMLPHRIALRAGETIGRLLYYLLPSRRAIGLKNLQVAFGDELSDAGRKAILKTTFKNLGKTLIETLRMPKISREALLEKVEIVGEEYCRAAKDKGRGLVYLTGHLGCWEFSSHAYSAAGYLIHTVMRPLDNPYLNEQICKRRMMFGNPLIYRGNGLRQILAALKKGERVGILMDQNTLRSKGIFVDFFGKAACTTPVIAILALRYNVPVVPGFIIRTGFDRHKLFFGPEIEIERSGNFQKDIAVNTEKFNKIIEDVIRRYPDQWFWIHNRWKTRPPGEAAVDLLQD
ncbi:lipid A biosynthesis acyltransferase [candidate division KSB3 bacterium]|uniref:Lipid A biosynthesis acyltransferase n=1 Tax=candidate division KSB3 bacterium TaxID=2044937 RepID=A0A2G6E368_9BACT|nr:MAG: lipid A biosynthesis acyltransferase [candidate division KSB3 bacterium]PIE28724.1 MAG: lipid A biosynthesis acyltransferase [candidate division KSB3 bacterium]